MRETSARLLALLSLLQARRDWPGHLLADRLDVSPRTVRRDVDRLRELGYPVQAVKEQVDSTVLVAVSGAVHAREVLRFDYATPGREPADGPPRRAEPHHLVTWGGRWYVVAWDLDREDWRTFRIDRLTPKVPNGPRFSPREVPDGDVAAFVAARFEGRRGPGSWPCRGEVILGLPAHVVSTYNGDGMVEELGPDRCRLVVGSWSWAGLAASLGRFDAEIEVVGPAELRDAFDRLSRRYAAAAG